MKKYFIISSLLLFFSLQNLQAQLTARDTWLSMPDSIIPYLIKSIRSDMIDFYEMKSESKVKDLLSGENRIDTLTTHFLSITQSEEMRLQLRILETTDSLAPSFCVVRSSVNIPLEGDIVFYDTQWNRIEGTFGLPLGQTDEKLKELFTLRPDTMSVSRYQELQQMLDPVMLNMSFDKQGKDLILSLCPVALTKSDNEQLKCILRQRKYKWEHVLFKES